MRRLLTLAASITLASIGLAAQSGYVPERVFESRENRFTDFEAMVADLAQADVVFVGEQHDDPLSHRLEVAILEGLARRRGDIVVALEMFERDVQEPLDHFQMGHLSEAEFLAAARPWPRYATDYKPLVDLAVAHDWPVVAANVPRPIASEVARGGLAVLDGKSDAEKAWFSRDVRCPLDDDYFDRFAETMSGHPADGGRGGGAAPSAEAVRAERERLERYYYAQCLKDETMAESVAQALMGASQGGKRPLVIHYNGAFHSDFGLGAAARARRRLPGKRVVVLSLLPVADLDTLKPDKNERKRADFLVYTYRKN